MHRYQESTYRTNLRLHHKLENCIPNFNPNFTSPTLQTVVKESNVASVIEYIFERGDL